MHTLLSDVFYMSPPVTLIKKVTPSKATESADGTTIIYGVLLKGMLVLLAYMDAWYLVSCMNAQDQRRWKLMPQIIKKTFCGFEQWLNVCLPAGESLFEPTHTRLSGIFY